MRLRALGNINSGQYERGDEFDLDDVAASALIEAGAAVSVDAVATEESDNGRDDSVVEAPTENVPLEGTPATPSDLPLVNLAEQSQPEVTETPVMQESEQPPIPPIPAQSEQLQPSPEELAQTISEVEQSSSSVDSLHIS